MKKVMAMLLFLCVVIVFSEAKVQAAGDMNGEWQISTRLEMPGMPMVIPGSSFTHCMDGEGIPHQESPDQECRALSRKVSGNTMTWHMSCSGNGGDVDMQGSSTYNGDSMTGSLKMITGRGSMTMQMQGQRIGPCR